MPVNITLDDRLVADLQPTAQRHDLSVEQLALKILTASVEESELPTPEQVIEQIRSLPRGTPLVRPATANLAELLQCAPEAPDFDIAGWNRQWAEIEAEQKAVTKAKASAES